MRPFKNRKSGDNLLNKKGFNGLSCKACLGLGHDVTDTDSVCYMLAKMHLCTNYMADDKNAPFIKANTAKYKKERREKLNKAKMNNRMKSLVNKLAESDSCTTDMTPLIKLAHAVVESDDEMSLDNESDTSTTTSE